MKPLVTWVACVLTATTPSLLPAQFVPEFAHIEPNFVPDTLLVRFAEKFENPDTGPSPSAAFAAAGVELVYIHPTSAPGELFCTVRLLPGSTLGRAFRTLQAFDFGTNTRWALRDLSVNALYCLIPEGCPEPTILRVFNFSTRAEVGVGAGVTIGGIIVPGEFPRLVVFKVRGPSLADFGVEGTLPDPRLTLFEGPEPVLVNEDYTDLSGWELWLANHVCPPPKDPREAMLVTYLDPGPYTAHVQGHGSETGIALLEMYLVDSFAIRPGPRGSNSSSP